MSTNQQLPDWLPDLLQQVRDSLEIEHEGRQDQRPALEQELSQLNASAAGWSKSLGNRELAPALRTVIEADWAAALDRVAEIEALLAAENVDQEQAEALVEPDQVLCRLNKLASVLAQNSPTLGNLELSLHIDRIQCSADGEVTMRTCKLGSLPDGVAMLAESPQPAAGTDSGAGNSKPPPKPRRRGRLRVDESDDDDEELEAARDFVTDPRRFAGLGDEWFWMDRFQVPDGPLSWVARNAEAVFQRRQEARLSFDKLGDEFGVSGPTARAATQHYLAEHPGAVDAVRLRPGGKRPPKFDVAEFAVEARQLWEAGWSKLRLASKYACSTSVIDRALAHAYAQSGSSMPERIDRNKNRVEHARRMLDTGMALAEIARTLNISTTTARDFLRRSFQAENKSMPDLRRTRPPVDEA